MNVSKRQKAFNHRNSIDVFFVRAKSAMKQWQQSAKICWSNAAHQPSELLYWNGILHDTLPVKFLYRKFEWFIRALKLLEILLSMILWKFMILASCSRDHSPKFAWFVYELTEFTAKNSYAPNDTREVNARHRCHRLWAFTTELL